MFGAICPFDGSDSSDQPNLCWIRTAQLIQNSMLYYIVLLSIVRPALRQISNRNTFFRSCRVSNSTSIVTMLLRFILQCLDIHNRSVEILQQNQDSKYVGA